ncbi:hypothetical protein CkaCkLH20_04600 [Colletotrichum karsti]|uniref:Uncharacterized protein n=1 Tax=Colletotrichum karsti TaxID=1095194 RepID=A0A9P6LJ59_9PEZI|nr:uncharacterized protein CkaCkLH20_04600 [Colletotrichum karsti]KAF9878024.1 hypothetical protein CkaCkLH20_04600 [Colletotrichum karsti]
MHFDTGDGARPTPQDEENYWHTLRKADECEEDHYNGEFMRTTADFRDRLAALDMQKRELEQRVLEVHQAIAREHAGLERVTCKFHDARRVRYLEREAKIQRTHAWFNAIHKRDDENRVRIAAAALAAPRHHVEPAGPPQPSGVVNGEETNGVNTNGEPHGESHTPPPTLEPVTMIMDASNKRIGPVHRIPFVGNIAAALNKPAKRAVQLRPGVSMTEHDLQRLHDNQDRWASIMMQAVGNIQTEAGQCSLCSRGEGPFAYCVIVEGLGACGNCHWERKKTGSCSSTVQPAESFASTMSSATPLAQATGVRDEDLTNGTATPVSLSRPVSRDKSVGPSSTIADDVWDQDLKPITRESLILKHDGKIYTHPECMEGVPVEKIDKTHPYWDPSWEEIAPEVQRSLESWQTKLDTALRSGQMNMKFQLGRQVNRGNRIMDFLAMGEFHPYQLVSKKYMTTKVASYDTVFRLADTISTLKKCETLDITPAEWLRQRLHEIIIDNGANFNLGKTIHDFYHDPKYQALRTANGIKSIGRPSGVKRIPKDSPQSAKTTPNAKKRRMFVSEETPVYSQQRPIAPTPTPTLPHMDDSERSAPPTPDLARATKKLKSRHGPSKDPDLAYEGFTDTDEFSGDIIGKHDWQLNRIKSRLYTVGTGVTQYWHWIPTGGETLFEHQVLAEGEGAAWGIYRRSINFHLDLHDIQELRFSPDTGKVFVSCKPDVVISEDDKPRGDLIAEFKRPRTKKRFLAFCRKKNVTITKIDADIIERAWDEYESPDVPAMGISDIS